MTTNTRRMLDVVLTAIGVSLLPGILSAEIDGHGPDAWRVTGVAADDVLNARMGPGTGYPVIETFAHDARGLEEIACVPFFTMAHYSAMTEAEIEALPPRWCLVRSADMSKAGWVAQRYLIAEGYEKVETPAADTDEAPGDAMIREAQELVSALYESARLARMGGPEPLDPAHAGTFFSADVVAAIQATPLQADPIYGAQDFDGSVSVPQPDPEQPMVRGMITINVGIENFGRRHTAVFRLRPNTGRPGAPLRIFRVEHDGWTFP
ncbi:hypothetical protein PSM7751_03875 [Pseudooceanicola marinus]|uniref:Uncharacterized protein n=1 Tax=Pseudooceanicola marinus TaxID=396013 RepID=A0A1X7A704_9RHOB|nr:hypothetical protein [Pseudooceanicola marinus]SLN71780.1 hypothetical protein PSM7751_03875 [Pseudooceanicola marinus]